MDRPKNHLRPDGMIRRNSAVISLVQRGVDAALLFGSLFAAARAYKVVWTEEMMAAAVLSAVAFQVCAPISGLYRSWRGTRVADEAANVLGTWLLSVPMLLLGAFLTKTTDHFSRVVMSVWLLLAPLSIILARLAVRALLGFFRGRGHNTRRVVIAGATETGMTLSERLKAMKNTGALVLGVYDDRAPVRLSKTPVKTDELLGNLETLVRDAREGKVDVIYIALPLRAERRIQDLVSRLADTTATVYVVTDLFMFDLMNARWGTVADMPVVSVFDSPFHGLGGWVKRAEDIVLASIILLIIALPMLFIGIAVKLSSPGPVFFKQTRYGLKGKPIKVLKFRSMTTCDNGPVVVQAKKNDARITPLGAFLRRTSLDELPQFWNVLMGDMSVVGPRPHAVAHNELYRPQIRGYMLRHKVKPGITGWAQVNGWRGEIEHDLFYIDNWSFFLDLKIVFLTVFGRKVRANAL
jgi:putative colanic acid biosynthesis UDP-glucose lipid carrier transferase